MNRLVRLDPARAGLPFEQWPSSYQATWRRATAWAPTPFRKDGAGSCFSAETLLKAEKALRRWLGFLSRAGKLDPGSQPCTYLVPELLNQFLNHLLECGNSGQTINGRFEDLKLAFGLMYPGQDFRWLLRPHGGSLRKALDMTNRVRFVPSSAELLELAEDMFQAGLCKRDAQVRCALIRDAVIVALLTTRGPRLRALSSLRLGVHLVRDLDGWTLHQDCSITKTGNEISLPLNADVDVMMDRYVGCERLEMLRGRSDIDALWISWHGEPLKAGSLANEMVKRTAEWFGTGFGPHRFRTALITTLALESPEHVLDGATILAHGPTTSRKNYNKAKATKASQRHGDRLAEMRAETRHLVRGTVKRGL